MGIDIVVGILGGWLLQKLGEFADSKDKKHAIIKAFEDAIGNGLERFAEKHAELSASLFDQIFLENHAGPELAKFLTRHEQPDAKSIAAAYIAQLDIPPPAGLEEAISDFLNFIILAMKEQAALQSILDRREIEETNRLVTGIHKMVTSFEADLKSLEKSDDELLLLAVANLTDLLGNARPGFSLLRLLREKIPRTPEPLLQRPELIQRLEQLVKQRKVILLTGTVHKGKTTVAQVVSSALCPEAWWVNLTGQYPDQVDNLFLALASQIESGDCPNVVVIDDLDISPATYRVYRDSLALVLHRGGSTGRGIILTAQGASTDSAVSQDLKDIVVFEIPELTSEEVKALCIEHGCPRENATSWGSLISAWTGGHPKLVQVRLAELTDRGWPRPRASDLTTQLPAVTSARQIARQLLSTSVTAPIAEFVYLVSETTLLHRSVAIKLSEAVVGLINGGDVLDNLSGKWLERIEGQWFRTTALLKGVANEVWSPEKRKWAHICLHDAIQSKNTLAPFEAAALLYHAYFGGEPRRLARTAMRLQIVDNEEARAEIERQLLWLPFVALEPGQFIAEDAMAGAILRGLQFRVASRLNSECLPQICARWRDEIDRIQHPRARALNQAMMWLSMGIGENTRVPLKSRLDAIMAIPTFPSEIPLTPSDLGRRFFEADNSIGGFPENGTATQAILLNTSRSFRGLGDLERLLQWLDEVASEDIREQFDEMLEWRIMQDLGAFVQSAWAAVHEQTEDWQPWLSLFERIDDYAKRRTSPRFGREAAKAKAIILTEYLGRNEEALTALGQAELDFGSSVVLMEQRANVLFQAGDDESVLGIWNKLFNDSGIRSNPDPFAYRRAGMSAARLKRWNEAGQIFNAGADSINPGFLELIKFGLRVDAALAVSLGGNQAAAARILATAVIELPAEAALEGGERWEAVQRAAVEVCRTIENSLWKPEEVRPKFEAGYASSPQLKVPKAEPGQAARCQMTRAQILNLFSTLVSQPIAFAHALDDLVASKYFVVRWTAVEARLALAFSAGAGSGFIEALLAFDRSAADFLAKVQSGVSLLEPDDGPQTGPPDAPGSWFGLLCAGVVCCGPDLLTNLKVWLEASKRMLGEEAAPTNDIVHLLKGASLSRTILGPAVIDMTNPPAVRCGAAAKLLLETLPAGKTLEIQAFLTSGMVSDQSCFFQQLFNRHVARHFAGHWRTLAQSPFHFYSPRTSIPELLRILDGVEHGSATLKRVLAAAANALMKPVGDFIERVL